MTVIHGNIFDIQKFCINDGPGIRTGVFFKGCPLHCVWCHNPESQKAAPQLMYSAEKCVLCGRCEAACDSFVHAFSEKGHTLDREKCIGCGKCADACPAEALSLAGKSMTADEVLEKVLRDEPFYKTSGGGMTVSGGEPFFQFGFLLELLVKAKEKGLHVCIETSGFTSAEKLSEAAKYTDIFLYDWKLTDPALHRKYTGVGNEGIRENLSLLSELQSPVILRCPIIPGVNDTEEHFRGIAKIAEEQDNITEVNIEPYHPLGIGKESRLGMEHPLPDVRTPDEKEAEEWIKRIASMTKKPVKRA